MNQTETNSVGLRFQDVTVEKTGKDLLADVSFELPAGKNLLVFGPAGSGKSVLLMTAVGLLRPKKGSISILGTDLNGISRENLYSFRMDKRISCISADFSLISNLTLYDNVALPLRYHFGLHKKQLDERLYPLLDLFRLKEFADIRPVGLSNDQKITAQLLRSMVIDPKFLILDEVMSGMDPIARRPFMAQLTPFFESKKITVVIISDNVHGMVSHMDYLMMLSEGKVADFGSCDEVMRKREELVRNFLTDSSRE